MLKVRGDVQHYAWGDQTTIPQLLARTADGQPWAELWLGTHPQLPSRVRTPGGGIRPLREVSGRLPFLLKILAAAEPLSLQAHPDEDRAADGFSREETAGIAANDPRRVYRDGFSKPEVLCALTTFEAIAGFRDLQATSTMLRSIGGPGVHIADRLESSGLAATIRHLLGAEPATAIEFGAACAGYSGPDAAHVRWLVALAEMYPGDPALAVAALMNFVVLRPGEALYLQPGGLHAYLRGAGVELMRSSDNVIRAGFTTKHRAIDELLEVLDMSPSPPPRTTANVVAPGVFRYDTPGSRFQLWRIELDGQMSLSASYGPELLLCTDGDAGALVKGEAGFVRPGETYSLAGKATIYRASNEVFD